MAVVRRAVEADSATKRRRARRPDPFFFLLTANKGSPPTAVACGEKGKAHSSLNFLRPLAPPRPSLRRLPALHPACRRPSFVPLHSADLL
uniref:Uncharacterized protein n=1 Tax=Oryza nivara TaxID=4536 RepID=A0A0E0I4V5_ORYNI